MKVEKLTDVVNEFLFECRNGDHESVSEDMFMRLKMAMHRADNEQSQPDEQNT